MIRKYYIYYRPKNGRAYQKAIRRKGDKSQNTNVFKSLQIYH